MIPNPVDYACRPTCTWHIITFRTRTPTVANTSCIRIVLTAECSSAFVVFFFV